MARICVITGKKVMFGKNISHANNKTPKQFAANIKGKRFLSETLGRNITLKVSHRGIRTVEHNGGLDQYLLKTPVSKLSIEARKIRKVIEEVKGRKSAVTA